MTQDGPNRPVRVWFAGDLEDPWVAGIADALSQATRMSALLPVLLLNSPGDLPDTLFDPSRAPDVLVLHRAILTRFDAERLARWRSGQTPPTRVVLCFGPHVRHAELERWASLVEVALPEATARETVARHLEPPDDPAGLGIPWRGPRRSSGTRPRVAVVSSNAALRGLLAEAVEAVGYPASASRDWDDASPGGIAVWDVPVLEPGWPDALARRAKAGPVVALLGFADRALVSEARARGASACLELPFDLADLAKALERISTTAIRTEPPHPTPPAPASRRRNSAPAPRVAEPGRDP